MTMVLTLVSQWVLQFPLAYVLSKHTALGAQGIWWAFPIANVVIALITICVYAKGDWKKKRLLDEEEVLTSKVSDEILSGEVPLAGALAPSQPEILAARSMSRVQARRAGVGRSRSCSRSPSARGHA